MVFDHLFGTRSLLINSNVVLNALFIFSFFCENVCPYYPMI
jgi:hypothetical protein